jgi:F420-non-reducing hydrogenase small subunit
MPVAKKKIAICSATGCRACENAVLDIHHHLSPLSRWADVSFWPYALGSQWEELDRIEKLDVCFFSGAIRTESDREAATKLRAKSTLMVACGACAAYGGLPSLENLSVQAQSREPSKTLSEKDKGFPLPGLEERVSALSQVIDVDFFVPGCPPTLSFLWTAFQSVVTAGQCSVRLSFSTFRLPEIVARSIESGVLPPRGTIFSGERAVCASCSRVKERKQFRSVLRPSQKDAEASRCLLEQGYLCLGIVSREGCGGLCTAAGLPCRGCFGKTDAVLDPGAKMVSAVGSTFDSDDPKEIDSIVEDFVDLKGTIYRYTAASQCLMLSTPKRISHDNGNDL